jgi:DNA-binding transcriptional ArsR family regulator
MTGDPLLALLDIDRTLHEPARLVIASLLYALEEADFTFLLNETGLTRGNLSSHLSKLEEAGYIEVKKMFQNRRPLTICRLNESGRAAYTAYRAAIQAALDAMPE